jgi:hypothetical protein
MIGIEVEKFFSLPNPIDVDPGEVPKSERPLVVSLARLDVPDEPHVLGQDSGFPAAPTLVVSLPGQHELHRGKAAGKLDHEPGPLVGVDEPDKTDPVRLP